MPGINEKGATSDVCHNCVCDRECVGGRVLKNNKYMLTSVSYTYKIDIPIIAQLEIKMLSNRKTLTIRYIRINGKEIK